MQLSKSKLFGLMVVLMAFGLIIAGCDGALDSEGDAHGVSVTINVPDNIFEASGEVGIQAIENFITVEEVKVTLFKDGETVAGVDPETIDSPDNIKEADYEYEVTFEGVPAGEDYYVEAKLIGDIRDESGEERTLYYGDTDTEDDRFIVFPDTVSKVEVQVMPEKWVSLEVTLEEADDFDGGLDFLDKVTLEHPSKNIAAEKDWGTKGDGDSVTFPDGQIDEDHRYPARWHLGLEFSNEDGPYTIDNIEILLLPTEERAITLEVAKDGTVEVIVDVHKSPDTPTGLDVDEGYLKWDPVTDATHYVVLRESEYTLQSDETLYEPVATVEAPKTKYLLFGEETGNYYVRAYVGEYSSDVQDDPAVVTDDHVEGVYNETQSTFYDFIEEALADANDDDTIFATGEFQEDLTINKPITLKGPNAGISANPGERVEEAIIEGTVEIESGAIMDGFKIVNAPGGEFVGADVGISIGDATLKNNIIEREEITFEGIGVKAELGAISIVKNNMVTGYSFGVHGNTSDDELKIKDNRIERNGTGVHLSGGMGGSTIERNHFIRNGTAIVLANDANDVVNNTLENGHEGIQLYTIGHDISDNDFIFTEPSDWWNIYVLARLNNIEDDDEDVKTYLEKILNKALLQISTVEK